ncbi:MAG: hypothetical protein H3C58_00755 [Fimbriimonadaceae bacterium]|nr:hypothetical protein [Fimbriimonadaceae bacterium]
MANTKNAKSARKPKTNEALDLKSEFLRYVNQFATGCRALIYTHCRFVPLQCVTASDADPKPRATLEFKYIGDGDSGPPQTLTIILAPASTDWSLPRDQFSMDLFILAHTSLVHSGHVPLGFIEYLVFATPEVSNFGKPNTTDHQHPFLRWQDVHDDNGEGDGQLMMHWRFNYLALHGANARIAHASKPSDVDQKDVIL